jgi:hypothetical protein
MRRGRVAQLGERLVRNEEAEGSNPFSSTKFLIRLHPSELPESRNYPASRSAAPIPIRPSHASINFSVPLLVRPHERLPLKRNGRL